MSRFLKLLQPPLNSVRTAVIILSDAVFDILKKVKASFARGPVAEISEYVPMVKKFFATPVSRIRNQISVTYALIFKRDESPSDRKRRKRST